jgi:hypothetical protein
MLGDLHSKETQYFHQHQRSGMFEIRDVRQIRIRSVAGGMTPVRRFPQRATLTQ